MGSSLGDKRNSAHFFPKICLWSDFSILCKNSVPDLQKKWEMHTMDLTSLAWLASCLEHCFFPWHFCSVTRHCTDLSERVIQSGSGACMCHIRNVWYYEAITIIWNMLHCFAFCWWLMNCQPQPSPRKTKMVYNRLTATQHGERQNWKCIAVQV